MAAAREAARALARPLRQWLCSCWRQAAVGAPWLIGYLERICARLCPFLQKGGRSSGILICRMCTQDLSIALVEMAPAK